MIQGRHKTRHPMNTAPSTLLVVPCYNEAERLPAGRFEAFAEQHGDVGFVFVNDGSRDRTQTVIDELVSRKPSAFSALELDCNAGKGEAVRAGMLEAIRRHPVYAGFWDADLSTPLEEIPRFVELYRRMPDKIMLAGSRVKMMGRQIERRAERHYAGRIFATGVSVVLDIQMYDTQCGAKLFRCTRDLAALFEEELHSKWLFDVELVLRIRRAAEGEGIRSRIYEVPLNAWRDVAGSKIGYTDFLMAVLDLIALRVRYRHWAREPASVRVRR